MNLTQKMTVEMNSLFKALGEEEIPAPAMADFPSELEFLRSIKAEYKKRLFKHVPKYKLIPVESLVPDMFLVALRNREAELEAKGKS